MSKSRKLARICGDLLIFVIVCAAELALHRWAKPVRRGFFCNDDALRYPYRPSTISVQLLLIIVLAVPPLLMLCIELCRCHSSNSCSNGGNNNNSGAHPHAPHTSADVLFAAYSSTNTPTSLGSQLPHKKKAQQPDAQLEGYRLWHRLQQCYKYIGYYLFGLALTVLATEVAKYSIGRLRPHFFALCQPVLPDGTSCSDAKNYGLYIEDFHCGNTNLTAQMQQEANLSFPSGHASVIFYAMFYVTLYVQCMCATLATKLLKHLLQFVAMMFAWYVALTRITDYWHHWSDVLVGICLGTLIAAIIGRYVAEFYGVRCRAGCQRRMQKRYHNASPQHQQIRPSNNATPKNASPTGATHIPAYTFGSLQLQHNPQQQHNHILQHLAQQQLHLQHQQQQQQAAAQSIYSNASAYANYGYVP